MNQLNLMSSHQDDLFDSVIFLEENCRKEGYEDGFSEGRLKGWTKGCETGYKQGKEIGSEIGFYEGFVQTWLCCCKENERIRGKLEALAKLLNQDWSDSTRDIITQLEQVRAKFKQICSMLNINIQHTRKNVANQLSF